MLEKSTIFVKVCLNCPNLIHGLGKPDLCDKCLKQQWKKQQETKAMTKQVENTVQSIVVRYMVNPLSLRHWADIYDMHVKLYQNDCRVALGKKTAEELAREFITLSLSTDLDSLARQVDTSLARDLMLHVVKQIDVKSLVDMLLEKDATK